MIIKINKNTNVPTSLLLSSVLHSGGTDPENCPNTECFMNETKNQ